MSEGAMAIFAALSATAGAAAIRALDWFGARRLGIGKMQRELVATLSSTNLAYRDRIVVLEAAALIAAADRLALAARVDALEALLRDALTPTPHFPHSQPARRRRPTKEPA